VFSRTWRSQLANLRQGLGICALTLSFVEGSHLAQGKAAIDTEAFEATLTQLKRSSKAELGASSGF
jgi:hypothetical protein